MSSFFLFPQPPPWLFQPFINNIWKKSNPTIIPTLLFGTQEYLWSLRWLFGEKMDQHKTETNLLERILGDNNTTEKLDIERKEVQENSNTVDFDKNL